MEIRKLLEQPYNLLQFLQPQAIETVHFERTGTGGSVTPIYRMTSMSFFEGSPAALVPGLPVPAAPSTVAIAQ